MRGWRQLFFIACGLASLSSVAANPLRQIEVDEPNSVLLPPDPKRPTAGPVILDRPRAQPVTTNVDLGTKYKMWRTSEGYKSSHGLARSGSTGRYVYQLKARKVR